MINNLIKYFLSLGLVIALPGCEKDYPDESRITYFPVFTMEGESEVIQTVGEPYTDGSVTATEEGNPLEVNVEVTGDITGYKGVTVNTDVMDKYVITYSATNADGFDGTVTRTVFVGPPTGDLISSLEGVYLGNVQRTPAFAVLPQYSNLKYINIWKTGDNTYQISCALGGYYYLGREYGYDFAFQGAEIEVIDIPSNSYHISQATAPGFGNVADITDFKVDATNKRITFTSTADFDAGVFHIQLEQVQY